MAPPAGTGLGFAEIVAAVDVAGPPAGAVVSERLHAIMIRVVDTKAMSRIHIFMRTMNRPLCPGVNF